MLAQNFKTAADLGIKDVELDALIKVLGMLERGEIDATHFNMQSFLRQADCGTVGCICGWANHISRGRAFSEIGTRDELELFRRLSRSARLLFAMTSHEDDLAMERQNNAVQDRAQPEHAAIALRSYLTTGDANWAEALA